MGYRFVTVDVFATEILKGNPLAVVLDAKGISDIDMQRIAREFNLAETTFVGPPKDPKHTAQMRIFTPGREVPFAGHPTVGTAAVLAELKHTGAFTTQVVIGTNVGPVYVQVKREAGKPTYAEFTGARLPAPAGNTPPPARVAAAMSLGESDLDLARGTPGFWEAGLPFVFTPLKSLDAVKRAAINYGAWPKPDEFGKQVYIYVYARGDEAKGATFHVRMFAPDAGVPEDPATGSAAAALPGHVHANAPLSDGTHNWLIEQGYEMGRPSDIRVGVDVAGGKITAVRVGGYVAHATEGTLHYPR